MKDREKVEKHDCVKKLWNVRVRSRLPPKMYCFSVRLFRAENNQGPKDSGRN